MAQDAAERAQFLTVIGGSAGSLSVLLDILPGLSASTNKAIIIVMHRPADGDAQLSHILSLKTIWAVKEAEDKDPILPGNIYIAPGGYHLLIEKDKSCSLDSSEKINYSRPSIDPTFETAADVYGTGLTCLLLSGANADGVEGLKYAVLHHAHAAVQHPDSALVSYMPAKALQEISGLKALEINSISDWVMQY